MVVKGAARSSNAGKIKATPEVSCKERSPLAHARQSTPAAAGQTIVDIAAEAASSIVGRGEEEGTWYKMRAIRLPGNNRTVARQTPTQRQ